MKKIIISVLIIIIGISIFCLWKNSEKCEVAVNGNTVAVFSHKWDAKKTVKKIIEEKQVSGSQINVSVEYSRTDKSPKSDEENRKILEKKIKIQVPCTIIVVNGETLLGLPSKDDAGLFLLKAKDRFRLPDCEEPEIKENITIDNSSIDADKYFKTPEDAVKYVFETKIRKEATVYTIKKGDTLSAIAKKYGTSVKEIKKLNPSLNRLSIGKKITLSAQVTDKPKITVVTRKEHHGIETVPPPVIKVSSKKIPFGKQKVIFPGKAGKKKADGVIIFENGEKVREENTFEEYIVQPQPKQIAVGI